MDKKTNKVIDYLTIDEVCDAIGIKRSSRAQITRWIQDNRIVGAVRFGKTWAIPKNWVQSECLTRNLKFTDNTLRDNEIGVSLNDYIDIDSYVKDKDVTYQKIYNDVINERINDYIRFGTTYGIRKEDIK